MLWQLRIRDVHIVFPQPGCQPNLARPQHLRSGSSVWHCSVGEKLSKIKNCSDQSNCRGGALYDDGQMINSDVINHVTKELSFSTSMAAAGEQRCVDRDVLEDIDSTFILKEEQRNAIKAFVDRKDVFAVLPTGFSKNRIYQLAPLMTTLL